MKHSIVNMRLTGIGKNYYANQLAEFASKINKKKYKGVQFGKQDIRGGISITLFDHNGCVPSQKHFNSKDEMLGFVVGVNTFFKGRINNLDNY